MGAQAFLVVATIAALIGLGAAGWAVQNSRSAQAAPAAGGQISAGRQVFQTAGCGGCHTLAAAGSTGTVGPNLDTARPSRALVVQRVTNGRRAMPSFKSQLAPDQIQAVASFVTASTGP
jgi:mono/diheme cytochrome c family protein